MGAALFDAILARPSGVTFAIDECSDVADRVGGREGRVQLVVAELLDEFRARGAEGTDGADGTDRAQPIGTDGAQWIAGLRKDFPLVLCAGERRSFTANTIIRDSTWRKRDSDGALRVSPADASRHGLSTGSQARIVTSRGSVVVSIEVTDIMQPGHVSLPNGMGLDEPADGETQRVGVAPKRAHGWFAPRSCCRHAVAQVRASAHRGRHVALGSRAFLSSNTGMPRFPVA